MNPDQFSRMKANTIEEVIQLLDDIIAWSKRNNSRMGYFAALYRKVTIEVEKGIEAGIFDDGKRMEKLDVIFANRYLEAFGQYQALQEISGCWKLSFDASRRRRPIVLQHLVSGMIAHIGLDLGIAAAETAGMGDLTELKGDFYKINEILASLVNESQEELARVWPLLKLLDYIAGEADEMLANFGMEIARGQAWKAALELAALPEEQRPVKIAELDQKVLKISSKALNPGYWPNFILLIIRIGEIRAVRKIVEILE
jgi:hypothetical protein